MRDCMNAAIIIRARTPPKALACPRSESETEYDGLFLIKKQAWVKFLNFINQYLYLNPLQKHYSKQILIILFSYIKSHLMFKTLTTLAFILVLASAFDITREAIVLSELQDIPWPYTKCGSGADWTIDSFTLAQTPKRNLNDDIKVAGTVDSAVTFKRVEINVKLNGVFLDKEVAEFTEQYDAGDALEFVYQNFIPSFAPIGTYGLTFSFIDSTEKENGCMQFSFKL